MDQGERRMNHTLQGTGMHGCRGSESLLTRAKVPSSSPGLPGWRSGYRGERDGLRVNRHLHSLVESIVVNVGGAQQKAKESSPPRAAERVGATIVVRGWESQPH